MSSSNKSAIKRRAPIEQPRPTYVSPNASIQQQVNTSTSSGLTLPQVIAIIDKRLVSLETGFKQPSNDYNTDYSNGLEELTNEIDSRFEIFIEELANLKNIVMSLQSYTMDVNKMLLEERSYAIQLSQQQQKTDDMVVADDSVAEEYSNGVKPVIAHVVAHVDEELPEKIVIDKVIPEKGKRGSRISV